MTMPLETPRRPAAAAGTSLTTPFKTPHRTPGEQTSQTPIVTFDVIEKQKENIAPSAKGRSAHSLSQTLALEHRQRMEKLAKEREEWEQQVSPESLAEEDDPVRVWADYIRWVVKSYPSGGSSADSGLIPLLERATRSLMSDRANHQQYQYLDMWIQYSRHVDNRGQILAWLLANEIGTSSAALYEESAEVAEARGLYEQADRLFKLGIAREAKPLPRLQKRHADFQARMRQQAGSSTTNRTHEQVLAQVMRERQRSMLGTKDEMTGKSQHANVVRGLGQSAGLKNTGPAALPNNGRKLLVHSDADGSQSVNNGKGPNAGPLPSRDVRRQENHKDAKSWAGERIPQRPSGTAAKPGKAPLQVMQDSDEEEEEAAAIEAAASPTKKRAGLSALAPKHMQDPVSERLKKNPFANWQDEQLHSGTELDLDDIDKLASMKRQSRGPSPTAATASTKTSTTVRKSEKKASAPAAPSQSAPSSSSAAHKSKSKSASTASSSSGAKKVAKTTAVKSTASITGSKREALAVPKDLLYPPGAPLGCCMEEIIAARQGWVLNLDGTGGDPWEHLDSQPTEEEQQDNDDENHSMSMSMSVAQGQEASDDTQEESSSSSSPLHHSREGSSTPTRPETHLRTAVPSREASATPTQSPIATRATAVKEDGKVSRKSQPRWEGDAAANKYLPSPTMMTKAAEAEIRALFNGGDDESASEGTSSCASSEDEDEHEEECSARAVPPTPTPASRAGPRPLDENAMVKATPLRPMSASRPALGSLSAATPMRKPLGTVAATPLGGIGQKAVFREEEEEDEEGPEEPEEQNVQEVNLVRETHTLATSARRTIPADEDEDEESDPEDTYEYEDEVDAQQLPSAPFAPHELTTITERTEYETKWGMATPGRNNSRFVAINEEDDDDDDQRADRPASSESRKEAPNQARVSAESGGKADFNLSPGETSAKDDDSAALVQGAPSPCSPTDPDVIDLVLRSIAQPVEDSPEFADLTSERSDQLAVLKKHVKAKRSAEIAIDGMAFAVREMLGEGAYGSVFLAEDVDNRLPPRRAASGAALGGIAGDSSFLDRNVDGNEDEEEDEDEAERRRMVAIKVETPPNKWEFYVLSQMRARLESRALQSIISARKFFAYQDESFLVLEWAEKGTLLEIVNQASAAGVAPAGAATAGPTGVEEVLCIFFVVELTRIVESIHRVGLLHGDLKIDNCLLRLDESDEKWENTYHGDGSHGWSSKGLYLVDFGRAIDVSVFPRDQQFVADWETESRDCLEMRRGQPWTYQVDYFGIASIAHVLLFGKYIETTQDATGKQQLAHSSLKRYWQTELWTEFFDLLLNPCGVNADGQLPIHDALAAMRLKMEQYLAVNANKAGKNLKGSLKKLEIWSMNRAS